MKPAFTVQLIITVVAAAAASTSYAGVGCAGPDPKAELRANALFDEAMQDFLTERPIAVAAMAQLTSHISSSDRKLAFKVQGALNRMQQLRKHGDGEEADALESKTQDATDTLRAHMSETLRSSPKAHSHESDLGGDIGVFRLCGNDYPVPGLKHVKGAIRLCGKHSMAGNFTTYELIAVSSDQIAGMDQEQTLVVINKKTTGADFRASLKAGVTSWLEARYRESCTLFGAGPYSGGDVDSERAPAKTVPTSTAKAPAKPSHKSGSTAIEF